MKRLKLQAIFERDLNIRKTVLDILNLNRVNFRNVNFSTLRLLAFAIVFGRFFEFNFKFKFSSQLKFKLRIEI